MTPQELKNSILQLAIQGKLVEQRPDEGKAEELYKQIQAEKQALVKAGKIKKEKPLPEITEDEIPFEIPETWKWVRLRSIVFNRGQETPSEEFCYIDIGSLDNKRQCLNEAETIIAPENAPSRARKLVEFGDILYSTVRPYLHNMCIIDRSFSHKPIASTGFAAMACHDGVNNKYMLYYLMSPSFDLYANNTENSKGVAYPAINDDRLYRALIALPPLAEQKRIVAKIEELLPLIDRYEKAWSRLEDFNKRFPGDMQKSILQMAIQGKLVEQRPEEGTGEELYRRIQAEKQALIKAGKIKKEKPLPEITEDEIPFEIPESWKWVRLSAVTDMLSGFAFKSEDFKPEGKYRLLRGINLGVNDVRWKETVYVDTVSDRVRDYRLTSGDVLLGLDRPWISEGTRVAIFDEEEKETYLVQRVLRIKGLSGVTSSFIALLLQSSLLKAPLGGETTGISVPHISPNQVGSIVVPLPPLAEQKRIVARLEELLPLCERLK